MVHLCYLCVVFVMLSRLFIAALCSLTCTDPGIFDRVGPPCFFFHKIHCGAVSIEKDKYKTRAHSLKTSRSSSRRHQTYRDALKSSIFPRTIPHWNSLSTSVANTQSTEEFMHSLFKQKISQKFVDFFFCCCCCCFCCCFFLSKFQN